MSPEGPQQPEASGSNSGGLNSKHNLAYDPDQDVHEKQAIRKGYYELLSATVELKENIENVRTSDIEAGLAIGNELFDKVKGIAEATLDSQYLIMASDMSVAKAKAMKNDTGGFDVNDFVSKLITYMGGRKGKIKEGDGSEEMEQRGEEEEEEDNFGPALEWEKIGRLALAKSHRVPVADFMFGPVATEPKQHKKSHSVLVEDFMRVPGASDDFYDAEPLAIEPKQCRKVRFEKNKEVEQAPKELTEKDIQRVENETIKNIKMIHKILKNQGEINLFQFICNPGDFGQSVENLFYLSFLIQEGKCALEFKEDTAEPIIFACKPPEEEDYENGIQKQQVVLELDMATWRRAIEVFEIKTCTIPDRPPIG